MKFVVERDALIDAVNWVARSLPTRPITPSVLGIMLEVSDVVVLTATDFETSTKAVMHAEITTPGKVLVPGRLLAEIARSLPFKPITFILDGTRVSVTSGSAKFTLPTLSLTDYPPLPALPETAGEISSDVFATAISQVATAAGRDESLLALTGIHIEINNETIILAATDRYRLAVKELTWKPSHPNLTSTTLVRARTLNDAAKSLVSNPQVLFALSQKEAKEQLVGFKSSEKTMTSRTLDGNFPAFKQLIPTAFKAEATIEVSTLLDSVRRVALVTDKTVPLRLVFADGTLKLEAGNGEEAQATEILEIDYNGDPINIAFNPTFLTDGLSAINSTYVHFGFTESNKPAVLSGKSEIDGPINNSYKYLLMPMKYVS